jgi:hypothetical protein
VENPQAPTLPRRYRHDASVSAPRLTSRIFDRRRLTLKLGEVPLGVRDVLVPRWIEACR